MLSVDEFTEFGRGVDPAPLVREGSRARMSRWRSRRSSRDVGASKGGTSLLGPHRTSAVRDGLTVGVGPRDAATLGPFTPPRVQKRLRSAYRRPCRSSTRCTIRGVHEGEDHRTPVLVAPETAHRSTWPMLARNFLEMVAAMWVGMALGGLIFVPILDALGMTASEATPQSDPPSLRPVVTPAGELTLIAGRSLERHQVNGRISICAPLTPRLSARRADRRISRRDELRMRSGGAAASEVVS